MTSVLLEFNKFLVYHEEMKLEFDIDIRGARNSCRGTGRVSKPTLFDQYTTVTGFDVLVFFFRDSTFLANRRHINNIIKRLMALSMRNFSVPSAINRELRGIMK